MPDVNYLEWIGYIGSVIVAISLTMTSMIKLRWLNFIGALIFTVYGVAINAVPVALVNGFITIIDIYFLFKIYTSRDYFELLELDRNDSYLLSFLAFYKKDIRKYFPDFKESNKASDIVFFVLRNMTVTSVFIGHKNNDGDLVIDVDYATPQYQDFKTGRFVFQKKRSYFEEKNINKLVVKPCTKAQITYYSKMGFSPNAKDGYYTKAI